MTFRRHMYFKNGNNTTYKSNFQEATESAHHKLTNGYSFPNQNIIEADIEDSYHSQIKDESSNKCSLIPLTVFGERIAKRIADEQNSENKDSVKRFNNKNDNNSENTEGYVIESDKENGSLTDTNIPNSTEIQLPVSTIYREDKCTKSSLEGPKLRTVNDIVPNNKNEMSSKPEEKSIPSANCIGKRARTNDETNRYDSKKRIKLTEEDSITETIKTEVNTDIESNIHINERRYSLKNWNTRHTRAWNKRPVEGNKHDERKDSKHRSSALRDDRDTSKKYHDIDVSKREDYRYNHNEYYKTKSRERDRSENYHWLRARSASFYREERYGRIQHTKYTSHEDKFQKRYNFHSNSMDKLKHFKEERDPNNTRCVTKGFTSERNSMDEKIEMKRNYRNNDYESQKVRSRSIDRPDKQRIKNTKDSNECSEHLESTNQTIEENGLTVERIEPIVKTEDAELKNELQNYAEMKLDNKSIELEDGQIFDTPENSPSKTEQSGDKVLNNEESGHRELDNPLFSNVNNSTLVKVTNNNLSAPNTEYVNSSISKEISENVSNNESLENVENIEKFINASASPRNETNEKETVTSVDIIQALEEGTTRNGVEINIANIVDICDREINSKTCTPSISKVESVVSLDQKHHELTKLPLPDEKCESTLTAIPEENLIKNDLSLQVTNINIAQDSRARTISTSESLKKAGTKKSAENYMDNTINDTRSDIKNVGSTPPDSMKTENRNLSSVTETRVQEEQEQDLKQSKTLSGNRNNDKNVKIKSVNASAKIIVLSRRRKPVCLTDTSANMTIHVNNE